MGAPPGAMDGNTPVTATTTIANILILISVPFRKNPVRAIHHTRTHGRVVLFVIAHPRSMVRWDSPSIEARDGHRLFFGKQGYEDKKKLRVEVDSQLHIHQFTWDRPIQDCLVLGPPGLI
jgi:hypothetical protein